MKSMVEYTADLFKHVEYLKRRAEITEYAIKVTLDVLKQDHPELADSFNLLTDAWARDVDNLNKQYGHK